MKEDAESLRERAAVVAWLRKRAQDRCKQVDVAVYVGGATDACYAKATEADAAADAIESGKHRDGVEALSGDAGEMPADLPAIAKRRAAADTIRGCGDNSCSWRRSSGMSTNGGCRCADQRQGPRIIQWAGSARTDIDALTVEVEQLRRELDAIRAAR